MHQTTAVLILCVNSALQIVSDDDDDDEWCRRLGCMNFPLPNKHHQGPEVLSASPHS